MKNAVPRNNMHCGAVLFDGFGGYPKFVGTEAVREDGKAGVKWSLTNSRVIIRVFELDLQRVGFFKYQLTGF